MSKILSGKKVIQILCRDFGFYFISQKGSHIKLKKRLISPGSDPVIYKKDLLN